MWLEYFKFGGNNLKVVHAVGFIYLFLRLNYHICTMRFLIGGSLQMKTGQKYIIFSRENVLYKLAEAC